MFQNRSLSRQIAFETMENRFLLDAAACAELITDGADSPLECQVDVTSDPAAQDLDGPLEADPLSTSDLDPTQGGEDVAEVLVAHEPGFVSVDTTVNPLYAQSVSELEQAAAPVIEVLNGSAVKSPAPIDRSSSLLVAPPPTSDAATEELFGNYNFLIEISG